MFPGLWDLLQRHSTKQRTRSRPSAEDAACRSGSPAIISCPSRAASVCALVCLLLSSPHSPAESPAKRLETWTAAQGYP